MELEYFPTHWSQVSLQSSGQNELISAASKVVMDTIKAHAHYETKLSEKVRFVFDVCVCVWECVRACVRACVCVCLYSCVCTVCIWYDLTHLNLAGFVWPVGSSQKGAKVLFSSTAQPNEGKSEKTQSIVRYSFKINCRSMMTSYDVIVSFMTCRNWALRNPNPWPSQEPR